MPDRAAMIKYAIFGLLAALFAGLIWFFVFKKKTAAKKDKYEEDFSEEEYEEDYSEGEEPYENEEYSEASSEEFDDEEEYEEDYEENASAGEGFEDDGYDDAADA